MAPFTTGSARVAATLLILPAVLALTSCDEAQNDDKASLKACAEMVAHLLPANPAGRADRFQGKVEDYKALCRGGQKSVKAMGLPWVDWGTYWGAADATSKAPGVITGTGPLSPAARGVRGALVDLEMQRVELIRFNLFDNNGTYNEYILGRDGRDGPAIKSWTPFNLPKQHPDYAKLRITENGEQICQGDLIRSRTLTGICNDVRNPLMGSTGQLFARNVEFESTFPDLGGNDLARARHGDRLGLLKPDPQVISRRLLTRVQSKPELCNAGHGLPGNDPKAECDYEKAPFFNVLAAFWIQFMTHDWFSHMEEGQNNTKEWMQVGCTEEDATRFGCRPGDRIDKGLIAQDTPPGKFAANGREYLSRAPKTMKNTNTAWWDASQIYGYDGTSVKRVKRDPADAAKLLLVTGNREHEKFLPIFQEGDPMLRDWAGQEATGFPDNYTIGVSFYSNLFAREHNSFVDEFRRQTSATPNADSGLRNPANPKKAILYSEVTPEELFQAARLVVSAEIAKIHTIEWTPQLLYNEPLYIGMNGNWNGLLGPDQKFLTDTLRRIVERKGTSPDARRANEWYSVFASGPGIIGLGSQKRNYDINDPDSLNGGVNHFGSAFNFPEEFITVYRLHALVPDLIEYRRFDQPNQIAQKVPVVETFRGKATSVLRKTGLANWGLSMGRQRLGLLTLGNIPQFLQNIRIERLQSGTKQIDVAALDLIRDREHGVPRFNEFRRQYGLRTLNGFDDFIAPDAGGETLVRQKNMVKAMREIYGQHTCDASKIISTAQKINGKYIDDCLGKPNGTTVDNIEDLDTVVGWLAEPVRPHGFAISETQFVVFILNASRRLFSDRFFTSGFRPEFYTTMGINWVNNNGPGASMMEPKEVNGHPYPVSPLKRVLLRNIPELSEELSHVVNAFDPWARDRGEYYSLQWKPRPGAESDPAFVK
jgi:hypothetical protein